MTDKSCDLAAALLRDVPLHDSHHDHGGWMYRAEVLAALRTEREWWKRDSAAAWDKCEERRIAQEAAEAKVEKMRGKIRDWEARIDACEWSTNSSLTEDIRAEMRATLTTEADNG